MYSPKIRDELIPKIYVMAKARGIRMTTLVSEIIEKALDEMNNNPSQCHVPGNRYHFIPRYPRPPFS